METELFLNQSSDQRRSLTDPWALTGEDLLFEPEVLLSTIMLKAGECAPLYSNAATFYNMNRMWWEKHRLTFQKWWEVIDDIYNPMWTNDFTRTITEDRSGTGSSSTRTTGNAEGYDDRSNQAHAKTAETTSTHAETVTGTADSVSRDQSKGEVENGVSAFDADGYQPHDKQESRSASTSKAEGFSDSVTQSETVSNGESGSGDTSVGNTVNTNSGTSDTVNKDKEKHNMVEHLQGNSSALMTGQRLLEDEIKVRRLNLYDMMADLFCDEMLIWLYV